MTKTIIPYKCVVCGTDLWFTEKSRNYRYREISKKCYYICLKCKVSELKKGLKGDLKDGR